MKVYYVFNLLRFVPTFFVVIKHLYINKLFVNKHIKPVINKALTFNDRDQLKANLPKIRMYQLIFTGYFGAALCVLRGKVMQANERMASNLQATFSALVDNFIDAKVIPDFYNMESLKKEDQINNEKKASYWLFFECWINFRKHFPERITPFFERIFHSENESKKQTNANESIETIARLTKEKGGDTAWFIRSVFNNAFGENEKLLLVKFGECVQIADDVFDIYEDFTEGNRTLATECKDMQTLKDDFIKLINEIVQLAYTTPYKKRDIKRFLRMVSLLIFCTPLVCLDMLKKNQTNTDGVFKVDAYTRKQLICDMEKPINMLRALKYFMSIKYTVKSS